MAERQERERIVGPVPRTGLGGTGRLVGTAEVYGSRWGRVDIDPPSPPSRGRGRPPNPDVEQWIARVLALGDEDAAKREFYAAGGLAMDGLELKLRRLRAGARQFDVARYAGVSEAVVSRLETGRRVASPDELGRILAAIDALATTGHPLTATAPAGPGEAA